jgi:hypothetical protein
MPPTIHSVCGNVARLAALLLDLTVRDAVVHERGVSRTLSQDSAFVGEDDGSFSGKIEGP